MNAPLLLSILIVLVCAELAFSHRSDSLAEEKVGDMSEKIKAALQEDADARPLYRLMNPTRNKRCALRFGGCKEHSDCCSNLCKCGEILRNGKVITSDQCQCGVKGVGGPGL